MKITDSLEKVYTAMGGAEEFDKTSVANGIEQISEVAGSGSGGGGGITIIPYAIFTAETPMSGGFIKSFEAGEGGISYVFYTYAELLEILQNNSLRCFAFYALGSDASNTLCTFRIKRDSISVHQAVVGAPSIDDSEPQAYMTDYYLKLNSDDTVEAEIHSWVWSVTNDD